MELLWTPSAEPFAPRQVRNLDSEREAAPRPVEPQDEISSSILKQAMHGDRGALEEFVRHYERRLFAFLYRAMGPDPALEDIAQDVFLCALRALPRFETGRAKVSTWLFQIAVHRLRDEFRRRRPSEELRPETLPSRETSPEAGLTEQETLHWVHAAVAQLPEDQRVALVLYEFHDMDIAEISEVLSTSPTTVKTRIFRARQKLIEAYARHNSDAGRSGR